MDTSPEIMTAIHELPPVAKERLLEDLFNEFGHQGTPNQETIDARLKAQEEAEAQIAAQIEEFRRQQRQDLRAKYQDVIAAIRRLPAQSREGLLATIASDIGVFVPEPVAEEQKSSESSSHTPELPAAPTASPAPVEPVVAAATEVAVLPAVEQQ